MTIDVRKPARELTGKHVLIMFLAFFGVVFAVNGFMLRSAITTFGGLETDSAYRAGLAYNQEIEASRRQAALGWTVNAKIDGERAIITVLDKAGMPVPGLDGQVRFSWPTDRSLDRVGPIQSRDGTRYEALLDRPLPPGQWDIIVSLQQKGERVFLSRNRVILN
jgi:nitrogen fixation protein FixH